MSVVVMEKYTLLDMLDSIQRYRITHVMYVVTYGTVPESVDQFRSIVPPQAVALCKVRLLHNFPEISPPAC